MLRKKSEIGKTMVFTRQIVTVAKMNAVKDLLRSYFDVMDVPSDEDGLIAFIIERFTKQRMHHTELEMRYQGHKYPDHVLVQSTIMMIDDILSQQKDNIALVDRILKRENDLLDSKEDMKDYMASGSFARGKEEKAASASMVFVGNINKSVDVLLKTSSLFDPFPPEMGKDTAFLDRLHCYLPGWEIPKFRPEHFTNDYGFITDYLSEFIRELRKEQYGDALDRSFRLGKNLNQRDTIAVRRMGPTYIPNPPAPTVADARRSRFRSADSTRWGRASPVPRSIDGEHG